MGKRKTTTSESQESKTCKDCGHNHTGICENCRSMDKFEGEVPKTPVLHEDGSYTGTINNPEDLDKPEVCKNHGDVVEINGDGIEFCAECKCALVNCDNCDDVNECTRCPDCKDKDQFKLKGLATSPVEEVAPGSDRQVTKEETVIEIPPNASPELVEQQFERAADAVAPPAPVEEGDWATFHDPAAQPKDVVQEEEGQGEPAKAVKAEPAWKGGPLDCIDQVTWDRAFTQGKKGDIVVLTPGTYTWDDDVEGVELTEEVEIEIDDPAIWTPPKVLDYLAVLMDKEDESQEEVPKQTGQMLFASDGGMEIAVASITFKKVVQVEIKLLDGKAKFNTTRVGLDNLQALGREALKEKVIPRIKLLTGKIPESEHGEIDSRILDVIQGKAKAVTKWIDETGEEADEEEVTA